jgi:RNA polymerase sigma-70 factor, ECF subfamily
LASQHRFEAIYGEEAEAVLRYLRYRVGPDEAEDMVAETFAVAWQKLDQVPDPPRAWLLAAARRVSANHLRSRRRRRAHEVGALDETLTTGILDSESVDRRRDLVTALKKLSSQDREAILLVTWYDLTHAEAAASMECSTTAFAVRLHRARRRLGAVLGEDGGVTDHHINRNTMREATR